MSASNYNENAWLNATLRNTAYTSPTTVYASLYSTAPTASTSGTELTGNGYSRQLTTFSSPSAGSASSNVAVTFGPATGNSWPTVVAVGIVDASTSGNILFYQTIANSTIRVGSSLNFASGAITVTIN
jgi:hypothetical protein